MAQRHLTPLAELLGELSDDLLEAATVPTWLKHVTHLFGVASLDAYSREDSVVYEGTVSPLIPDSWLELPLGPVALRFLGGEAGMPFTLGVARKQGTAATNQPTILQRDVASTSFELQVRMPALELIITDPKVRAATLRTEPHYILQPSGGAVQPTIRLPNATLVIGSDKRFFLSTNQSWEDLPAEAADALIPLGLEPRYVLFGDHFGMGLSGLTIDLSSKRSTAAIMGKPGYGAKWRGVTVDEALMLFLIGSPETSLAVHGQDMVFGEGGVSGKFLAEFAKDHPLDDGRVKVSELKLLAVDVSPFAPLASVAPKYSGMLEALKGEHPKAPMRWDAFFSRERAPATSKLRLAFSASGAKKNAQYQVRLRGKVIASGAITFVKNEGGVHPSVAVETKDLSLPTGEHDLVVNVFEALPVSSGTQRVVRVELYEDRPELAEPIPTLEVVRGSGGAPVRASAGFVDGEVPLELRGSASFTPIGDHPNLSWTLRERGNSAPAATSSGSAFTHTLSKAGTYELELLYEKAGQWVRARMYAIEAYPANPYADAIQPVISFPDAPTFDYPGEVHGARIELRTKAVGTHRGIRSNLLESLAPLAPKLVGLVPAAPTTSVLDLVADPKISTKTPSSSRHASTWVAPTHAHAYVARFELELRQLAPDTFIPNGFHLVRTAAFTTSGGKLGLSAAARKWIAELVQFCDREPFRPTIQLEANGERPTNMTTAALQAELDTLAAALRAGLTAPASGWTAEADGSLRRGARTLKITTKIVPGNIGLEFGVVAPLVVPMIGKPIRRVAYVYVPAALPKGDPARDIADLTAPRGPTAPPRGPGMFRYPWFRRLRVDLELHRNILTRGMLEAIVDLHEGAKRALPPGSGGADTPGVADPDGLSRIPLVFTQDPATGRMRGEAALVADPRDKDGLRRFVRGKDPVAPWINPLFAVLPPMVALGGSNFAAQAGLAAGATGLVALLEAVGYLKVPTLQFQGVRVRYDHLPDRPTTWALRVGTDYQVELEVDFKPLGMKTSKPIVVKYRDVGLAFGGEHGVAFDFDPKQGVAVDVADEGLFKLPAPLGSILTVTFVRLGIGSPLSLSLGLRLNLSLGAFKIDRFQGKLSFDPEGGPTFAEQVKFSVSPIRVAVDVKDLMKGAGLVEIGERGFSANVDLSWRKPKLRLAADFAYQNSPEGRDAVYAAVFGEWAAAIPLGGAGLYGLGGLFGMNFVRKDGDDAFAWYAHHEPKANVQSLNKWEVKFDGADRFAVGLGAVLGTLGDGGRAFNAKGVLLVEIPGPRILLFMRANLLSARPKLGSQTQGTILAVLDLDFIAKRFLIQLQVDYQIPKVLKVIVPAEVFFDLSDPSNFHIYLGRDKPANKRITIQVLGFIDAWGYLMIDGQGISNLANTGRDLRGFSIALGFRSELSWGSKAANLYLSAFVEAHVGLGTDPVYFYGKLGLGGELMLVIIGIGVRAELAVQAGEGIDWSFEGKICGKLRLLFWEIEGCIDFALGPAPKLPAPSAAVEGLALVDPLLGTSVSRRESKGSGEGERTAVRGVVVNGAGGSIDWASVPEVPIDTIPVLEFRSPMNGAPTGSLSFAESHSGVARETPSDEYFIEYTLREVEVFEIVEGRADLRLTGLPGVWLADTYTLSSRTGDRPGVSADDRRSLAINEWSPVRRMVAQGREGETETVARRWMGRLCDPVDDAPRYLWTFDGQDLGAASSWTLPPTYHLGGPVLGVSAGGRDGADDLARAGRGAVVERAIVVERTPSSWAGSAPIHRMLRIPDDGEPLVLELGDLEDVVVHLDLPAGAMAVELEVVDAHGGTRHLGGWELGVGSEPHRRGVAVPLGSASTVHFIRPASDGELGARLSAESATYLVAVEGRARAEIERANRAKGERSQAASTWANRFGQGVSASGTLWKPGARYLVRGEVQWKTETTPRDPKAKPVVDEGTQSFGYAFRTGKGPASEAEIGRYVARSWPPADALSWYCDDPLALDLRDGAALEMLRADGRQVVLAASSARSTAHAKVGPFTRYRSDTPEDAHDKALLAALEGAPCLGVPRTGAKAMVERALAELGQSLVPNAEYEARLLSLPASADLTGLSPHALAKLATARGTTHHRWRFHSSRWSTFEDHVLARADAMADIVLDAPPPEDWRQALKASQPETAWTRDDGLLERLIHERLKVEVRPPAEAPTLIRLWHRAGGSWTLLGLLVDDPEPLLEPEVALQLHSSQGPLASTGVVNARSTRALVLANFPNTGTLELHWRRSAPTLPNAPASTDSAMISMSLAGAPDAELEVL